MFQVDSRSRSCEKVKVKVIFDSLNAEICVCVYDTAMAPTPGHDVAPSSEDVVMTSLPDHDVAPSTQASEPADNTYNTILNVTQKKRKKEKLKKTYIVPMWAATKSLLQSGQCVNHTNSEVVAPLFKTPPPPPPNGLRNIVQRPHPHSRDLGRCGRTTTAHRHHTRPRLV